MLPWYLAAGNTLGPKRALCGFERVHLAPGATKTVTFGVSAETLKTVVAAGDVVTQAGSYRLEFTNGVDQSLFAEVSCLAVNRCRRSADQWHPAPHFVVIVDLFARGQ